MKQKNPINTHFNGKNNKGTEGKKITVQMVSKQIKIYSILLVTEWQRNRGKQQNGKDERSLQEN